MSQVLCQRCGEQKPALERAPLPSEDGSLVLNAACADCWKEWSEEEVRTINELRLNFIDPEAQKILRDRMIAYLNLATPEAGSEEGPLAVPCDRTDTEPGKPSR